MNWGLAASIITAAGSVAAIVITAFFSLREYRRNIELQRLKMLDRLRYDFYVDKKFKAIRDRIDSQEGQLEISRLMVKEIKWAGLTKDEDAELADFADYLNFFEYMFYLVRTKRVRAEDVDAMFDYYIKSLAETSCILEYAKSKGFEEIQSYLEGLVNGKFFFYGTLRQGKQIGLPNGRVIEAEPLGDGHIDGAVLYDLGDYPGAVEGREGRVFGTVYRLKSFPPPQLREAHMKYMRLIKAREASPAGGHFDALVFRLSKYERMERLYQNMMNKYQEELRDMDDNECFYCDPDKSEFVRKVKQVQMDNGAVVYAYTYIYVGSTEGREVIKDGVWKRKMTC